MNKLIALLIAAPLAFVPMSAQANSEEQAVDQVAEQVQEENQVEQLSEELSAEKALVIIDAYFDSSKISGEVVDVCIARVGCDLVPSPTAGTSSAFNHGTAMAYLARKANPDVKLYLVRAASSVKNARTGTVSLNLVSGNDFLNALKFVQSKKDEVGAVSFSYSMNGNMQKAGECRLSTYGGVNVSVVDPQIRSTIAELKSDSIVVFAATGNGFNRTPVSYPACISDVASVASGFGDKFLSSSNHDANTDYVGALPERTLTYTSTVFGSIMHATSSATASVAAMWLDGLVTEKWVRISR